jgi:predicted transcriptional regulator
LFRFQEGKFVVNEKGKVVEVSGGLDNENQNIIVANKNGKV